MSVARRVRVVRPGGPEVLEVESFSPKPARRGEARVQVRHAGVAFGDVMRRRGVLAPPWSFTPGYDVVGEVTGIGAGVDRVRVGQRVAAFMPATGFGGYASHVTVPAERLVLLPDAVTDQEAIGLGLNAITARQLLTRIAPVTDGATVLVHGAAGGVGTMVLDIGARLGLRVLGTASAKKHALVRSLGGEPIDYRTEDFVARVLELTDGRGADVVIDGIGGDHLSRSHEAVTKGGTLVCLGVSGDVSNGLLGVVKGMRHPARFMLQRGGRRTVVYGITASPGCGHRATRDDWAWLVRERAAGRLRAPHIGGVYPLDRVCEAHLALDTSSATGKLLLQP